jgi:hypothetical protein
MFITKIKGIKISKGITYLLLIHAPETVLKRIFKTKSRKMYKQKISSLFNSFFKIEMLNIVSKPIKIEAK